MSIKILVDSSSDISKVEAEELGIEVIPMQINFGSEEYFDGENLLPNEFYNKLISSNEIPKTSQINPYRFEKTFKRLTEDGSDLIVITISSKLSNTYNSAVLASQKFGGKVRVLDSLSATIGERLLVIRALNLIKENKTLDEIMQILENDKNNIVIMALVDTLEYLKKGGRISSAVAFAGELLSIKPILSVIDGEVKMIGKARGAKKANKILNKMIEEKGEIDFTKPCGVVYGGLNTEIVEKYISESNYLWNDNVSNMPYYIIGSTIGTHVGPGAVGFAFFKK